VAIHVIDSRFQVAPPGVLIVVESWLLLPSDTYQSSDVDEP